MILVPVGQGESELARLTWRKMLTWVEAPWRHHGIGTAMKHRAVQNARRSGITALCAPGDTRSVAFYKSLGVAPAAGFTVGLPQDLPD